MVKTVKKKWQLFDHCCVKVIILDLVPSGQFCIFFQSERSYELEKDWRKQGKNKKGRSQLSKKRYSSWLFITRKESLKTYYFKHFFKRWSWYAQFPRFKFKLEYTKWKLELSSQPKSLKAVKVICARILAHKCASTFFGALFLAHPVGKFFFSHKPKKSVSIVGVLS